MRRCVVALLLVLAACAAPRETMLSDAQLAALAQGQTTRTQAVALLGQPAEVRSAAGGIQLVYAWRLGQSSNINTVPTTGITTAVVEVQRREVVLSFDAGDILQDISRTTQVVRNGAVNVAPR